MEFFRRPYAAIVAFALFVLLVLAVIWLANGLGNMDYSEDHLRCCYPPTPTPEEI